MPLDLGSILYLSLEGVEVPVDEDDGVQPPDKLQVLGCVSHGPGVAWQQVHFVQRLEILSMKYPI